MQRNLYFAFPEEEEENAVYQEVSNNGESKDDEDIDYYCKQFAEFMLAQPQRKYNLRSSKKRLREPEQQEENDPRLFP